MDRIVIIADDFTGASDSGVHFARRGIRTTFLFSADALGRTFTGHDALALSAETRFLPPREAAARVRELTRRCREAGGRFFFKKVDSALRGNPGVETEAMLRTLDRPAALICSAMPAAGRCVVDGMLFIDDQPVHTTNLGRDPFTPVLTSNVAEHFTKGTSLKAGLISLADIAAGPEALDRKAGELLKEGCSALVADAASEEDLAALCGLVLRAHDPASNQVPLLPVGSSGLAKALAGPPLQAGARPAGRLLAVVGSLNESALEQAGFAVAQKAFSLFAVDVDAGLAAPDKECERLLAAVKAGGEGHVLLRGLARPGKGAVGAETGAKVAELYGRLAHTLCRELPFASVFATGGSTAVAVAMALGMDAAVLVNEILPGVVLSTYASPDTDVRWFISKAGSFGDREALVRVAEAIDNNAR